MAHRSNRTKAADAWRLANDLSHDLRAGVQVYELFQAPILRDSPNLTASVGVTRTCLFHVVVGLAKYAEWYDYYKGVLPDGVVDACKATAKAIKARDIPAFRNKVAGHVHDNDTKRPVPTSEMMDLFEEICRGDFKRFLAWVSSDEWDADPTVVATLEAAKSALENEYKFTRHDMRDHEKQMPRIARRGNDVTRPVS